jgi:hypothetical protein
LELASCSRIVASGEKQDARSRLGPPQYAKADALVTARNVAEGCRLCENVGWVRILMD